MLAKLKVDGRSFHPQLRGKTGNLREWTYCLYLRYGAMKKDEYSCTEQLQTAPQRPLHRRRQ
jgi:hypothetical protein